MAIQAHIGSAFPAFGTVFDTKGRGKVSLYGAAPSWRQLLATDSPGNTSLTLQNVVSGSRYRVEDTNLSDALVTEGNAAGGDIVLSVPYYTSPHTFRIKVRKGTSAPKYQPFEILSVVTSSGASVYVSQVSDTIAS